jgi:hypothetical protein
MSLLELLLEFPAIFSNYTISCYTILKSILIKEFCIRLWTLVAILNTEYRCMYGALAGKSCHGGEDSKTLTNPHHDYLESLKAFP